MFKPRRKKQEQKEFWVMANRLPKASPSRFYELLNKTLEKMDFANQVRERCAPAYAKAARGGRPGIDPVVYFKMLMIGFFEGLESERQIAARCADSLSLPGFLGYALDEATPEHSSMSASGSGRAATALKGCLPWCWPRCNDTVCSKAGTWGSTRVSSRPMPACAV